MPTIDYRSHSAEELQTIVPRWVAEKTRRSSAAVKKAVKKVGNSRKRVERQLGR